MLLLWGKGLNSLKMFHISLFFQISANSEFNTSRLNCNTWLSLISIAIGNFLSLFASKVRPSRKRVLDFRVITNIRQGIYQIFIAKYIWSRYETKKISCTIGRVSYRFEHFSFGDSCGLFFYCITHNYSKTVTPSSSKKSHAHTQTRSFR